MTPTIKPCRGRINGEVDVDAARAGTGWAGCEKQMLLTMGSCKFTHGQDGYLADRTWADMIL